MLTPQDHARRKQVGEAIGFASRWTSMALDLSVAYGFNATMAGEVADALACLERARLAVPTGPPPVSDGDQLSVADYPF